jgi:hypothetical protein
VDIWYILWPFAIFCGHLVYFVAIWYILWLFGIFLECCTEKNLATLTTITDMPTETSRRALVFCHYGSADIFRMSKALAEVCSTLKGQK